MASEQSPEVQILNQEKTCQVYSQTVEIKNIPPMISKYCYLLQRFAGQW
jgi:hypothetical protein